MVELQFTKSPDPPGMTCINCVWIIQNNSILQFPGGDVCFKNSLSLTSLSFFVTESYTKNKPKKLPSRDARLFEGIERTTA